MTKQSKCSEYGNPIYAYTSVKVGKCYRCRGKKKMDWEIDRKKYLQQSPNYNRPGRDGCLACASKTCNTIHDRRQTGRNPVKW